MGDLSYFTMDPRNKAVGPLGVGLCPVQVYPDLFSFLAQSFFCKTLLVKLK